MKYYTRTGDDGYTALLGGERVPKYAPRPEAYGTVDEVSSALGLARATVRAERSREILLQVQRHLYQIKTELATTPEAAARFDRTSADDRRPPNREVLQDLSPSANQGAFTNIHAARYIHRRVQDAASAKAGFMPKSTR